MISSTGLLTTSKFLIKGMSAFGAAIFLSLRSKHPSAQMHEDRKHSPHGSALSQPIVTICLPQCPKNPDTLVVL